jgi:ribonuclease Z
MGYLVDIPAVSLVIKPSELGAVMHCTGEGDVVVELQVKPPVEAAHIDVTVKNWTDRPTSGMLLTMGNAERTEPLTMIGPKGLEHVVNSLRIIAPELPFEIKFIELEQPEEVIEICGLRIRAFRVNHRVTCYGYNIELDRAGKFDAARARALGLPVQYWSLLQKGETVDYEENVYTSDMVMGSPRKGLKVTYCTDTRPVDAIAECAKDADLFICEGMYGEEEKLSKAKEHKHMMMREAAELAKEAQVHEMWLTHYSPATNRPKEFEAMVQSIFPQGYIAKDRTEKVLNFEED